MGIAWTPERRARQSATIAAKSAALHKEKPKQKHKRKYTRHIPAPIEIEWWVIDAALRDLRDLKIPTAVILSALSTVRKIHTERNK